MPNHWSKRRAGTFDAGVASQTYVASGVPTQSMHEHAVAPAIQRKCMRLHIGILLGFAILSGCAIAPSPTALEPSAIPATIPLPPINPVTRVFASLTHNSNEYYVVTDFPTEPSTVPCTLRMYTPPRLDGTSGAEVPATCTTSVIETTDTWIVRFTETWDSGYFRSNDDHGLSPFHYTWEFTLDRDGQIRARHHFGQFPPQYVHWPFPASG